MGSKNIFGHQNARHELADQLETGRLSHAYLFLGPEGIGKYLVALEFADKILENDRTDFFELDLAGEDGANSIEKVRDFMSIISSRPVAGQHKVAIINNFDLANTSMENALLKTLEEPSASTILILISSRQPLPTVLSRTRTVVFNRLSKAQLQEFINELGLEVADDMYDLSAGSPARLIKFSNQSESTKKILKWSKKLTSLMAANVSDKLLAVSELGSEETATLREVLLVFLEQQRARLADQPQLAVSIRKTLEALELLRSNLNKKLVLQRLLL